MNITDCMRALTSFDGYDGYVIGKLVVKQEVISQQNTKFKQDNSVNAIIKKQKEDYAVLFSEQRYCDMDRSVTMYLMKPKEICSNSVLQMNMREDKQIGTVVKHITFSQEEVDKFTDLVQDTNPIHHGKDAIVPGMLIAKMFLESIDELEVFQLTLKFKAPMLVGQELIVILEDERNGTRHLIVKDSEYKTVRIEGDMICEKYIL